ncbi:unnamed protein product [Zymoseptoria tritici ST99CH_1A5]|nr:unnamed protein product [Zymoseptoria tritici ST99CH_1A5]
MASFDSMPGADRFHETETSVDQDTTETEAPETANENFRKLCNAIKTMLECIGEDPNRKDLLETPRRYAQALIDLTSGYKLDTHAIVGEALFHGAYTGMVVVKDIEVHSLCEHHLLPFLGKIHIAYIPNSTVIGLSKVPRIVQMYSHRLQIQERLTSQVAYAVQDVVKAKGVAVVMEASHLCMKMRGVEQTDATTVTSCFMGCFDEKPELRSEFLRYVGVRKG